MPATAIKAEKKTKRFLIKMTEADYEEMKKKAERYTKGNVSDWIRFSSKLTPRKEDVSK